MLNIEQKHKSKFNLSAEHSLKTTTTSRKKKDWL